MKSHRPERVGNVIRAVVSDAITNKLSDPRIEPMSSVTRVEVSGDLEYAKVWVSVMGESTVQRRTIDGLRSARGYVQGLLAKKLPIRHCPRISFHLDESIKKATETIRLIDEAMSELEARTNEVANQECIGEVGLSSGEDDE
ncbi:MAG: 30S ribosome-binding factor RbfA [Planctomycetota bacterium]|nr:MAG: 30S ribosome-binding factor RbfA [Planctomycetota bacterium]